MLGWIRLPRRERPAGASGRLAEFLPGWLAVRGPDLVTVAGTVLPGPPRTALSRREIALNSIAGAVLLGGLSVSSGPVSFAGFAVLAIVNGKRFWEWVRHPPKIVYVVDPGIGAPSPAVTERAEELIAYERGFGRDVRIDAGSAAGVFFRVRARWWPVWVAYWVRSRDDGTVVLMRLALKSSGTWIQVR